MCQDVDDLLSAFGEFLFTPVDCPVDYSIDEVDKSLSRRRTVTKMPLFRARRSLPHSRDSFFAIWLKE